MTAEIGMGSTPPGEGMVIFSLFMHKSMCTFFNWLVYFLLSFVVGPSRIEFSQSINLEDVRQNNLLVREGGRYIPSECTALQKVAVIIPFRDRDEHLKYWLYYLHPILQRQQLDYGVYVINQVRHCYCNIYKVFTKFKMNLIFLTDLDGMCLVLVSFAWERWAQKISWKTL